MTSEKRIHRAKHDKENPYYIASRDTAQDKVISYDALGMLHYVLSKPDDWDIQPNDLIREKCKLGKVYVILKELIQSNYIERIYHRDEKKRIVMVEYIAREKPLFEKQKVAKPKVEKRNRNTVYRGTQSTEKDKSADAQSSQSPSKTQANTNTINGIPPSGKGKRSEKSTPLQMWLARLPAVKPIVASMLTSCYDGWDAVMMSPENSLTVSQLENYITNAEEYVRLGGKSEEVGQVYEFIGDVDYTIAPKTIAGWYLRWKQSQKVDDTPASKPVEPAKREMTEIERAERLAKMKADRVLLFS